MLAEPEPDIVVPFPAARNATPGRSPQALAERLATALASAMSRGVDEPTVGVELRRETATFRVPVSQAALPEGLAGLAAAARAEDVTASALEIGTAPQLWQLLTTTPKPMP